MATLAVIRCSLRSLAARSRVDCNFRGAALYSTPSSLNSAPPTEAVTRGNRASPRAKQRREPVPPRTEKMEVDQNWCNVYPTASAFKPSVVPLPIRMGYPIERGVPPDKIGNLELIKISNFLHLTPPAIKRHCTALKEFCTEWPAALDSDEKCEQHFPIKIETTDYVAAGPSLRNPKARMVTLTVQESQRICFLPGAKYRTFQNSWEERRRIQLLCSITESTTEKLGKRPCSREYQRLEIKFKGRILLVIISYPNYHRVKTVKKVNLWPKECCGKEGFNFTGRYSITWTGRSCTVGIDCNCAWTNVLA
ncbi:28S ribosomal protein S35, mitochondrial isoform X2 [Carcharodon carcharias]|uniref:28S ribosomal protein S35, mitochondrial isoform X2 n=1 Tax=Carcharodon carcharias TaxID=13397 RepID=UPI001B7F5664|nr:28S ribosomal protein S35, mitochondrial isoform X2 [Carcharodon carcharias]